MKKTMAFLLWAAVALFSQTREYPTDTDLRAAYCLSMWRNSDSALMVLNRYSRNHAESLIVEKAENAALSNFQKISEYLNGRLIYVDALPLEAARQSFYRDEKASDICIDKCKELSSIGVTKECPSGKVYSKCVERASFQRDSTCLKKCENKGAERCKDLSFLPY